MQEVCVLGDVVCVGGGVWEGYDMVLAVSLSVKSMGV